MGVGGTSSSGGRGGSRVQSRHYRSVITGDYGSGCRDAATAVAATSAAQAAAVAETIAGFKAIIHFGSVMTGN